MEEIVKGHHFNESCLQAMFSSGFTLQLQYVTINLISNFMGIGGTVHYAIQGCYNFCACGQVV